MLSLSVQKIIDSLFSFSILKGQFSYTDQEESPVKKPVFDCMLYLSKITKGKFTLTKTTFLTCFSKKLDQNLLVRYSSLKLTLNSVEEMQQEAEFFGQTIEGFFQLSDFELGMTRNYLNLLGTAKIEDYQKVMATTFGCMDQAAVKKILLKIAGVSPHKKQILEQVK